MRNVNEVVVMRSLTYCFFCMLTGVVVASAFACPALASELDDAEHAILKGSGEAHFVTPPFMPTEVEISLTLLRISRIDPPSKRFPTMEIEAFMEVDWNDPRLAYDSAETGTDQEVFLGADAELELERIWWPDVIIQNELHKRESEDMELVILPSGEVDYKERFSAVIPLDFDLHKFPFDTQTVHIDMESFSWDDHHLVFVHGRHGTGVGKGVNLRDWQVVRVGEVFLDVQEARSDEGCSEMRLEIEIKREPLHYVKTIFVPLGLILFMLCAIVYADLEKRIEFILIALLSLVAFNGIIAEDLPKLKDLIFLDVLILLGYVITLLALVEAVLAQRFKATGQRERAERMETTNRKVFPYVLGLIVCGGVAGYLV